jgi:hypothetical protein
MMMRKMFLVLVVILIPMMAGTAVAQDPGIQPLVREGVQEVGVSGNFDPEGPHGGVDIALNASYGYFLSHFLEVGGFGSYLRADGGDLINYGLGAFGEYHLLNFNMIGIARSVPYIGANLGLYFAENDFGDNRSGLAFIPRAGIKWFFRDYVAVDTNFFFALATDDIYVNNDKQRAYDYGFNIGLRVYFE